MDKQKIGEIISANKTYSFLTKTVSYKSVEEKGKKNFYVTGYISVPEVDIQNDLVTPAALKSMLKQIKEKSIALDYEHEAWRDDNTILPAGKIVEAKIDDRGLFVKAKLNPASPKFKSLWESVKGGFVNAFSIAFKPIKTVMKDMKDAQVRLIEDLILLNVALTGAPVNQGAVMTDYGMKSVMLKAIKDMEKIEGQDMQECVLVPKSVLKDMEETKMVDTKKEPEVKDEPKAEETPEVPEDTKEEPKEEGKEETKEEPKEEPKEEAPAEPEQKSEDKILKEMKSLTEKVVAQEKELKSLKETAVFKSQTPEPVEEKSEEGDQSVMDMIK